MCDHNDINNLEYAHLQASDFNTRYKCKNCNEMIIKHINKDIEFNRKFRRHHNLCVKHEDFQNHELPTFVNDKGKKCCNWCGIELE